MKRILLIEDDNTMSNMMVEYIIMSFKNNVIVDTSENFLDAITIINSRLNEYFAIISDVVIPYDQKHDSNNSIISGFDIGKHTNSLAVEKVHFIIWSAFVHDDTFENFVASLNIKHVQFHSWPKLETLPSLTKKFLELK